MAWHGLPHESRGASLSIARYCACVVRGSMQPPASRRYPGCWLLPCWPCPMDALKGGRKSIIDRGSRVRRLLPQVKHQLRPYPPTDRTGCGIQIHGAAVLLRTPHYEVAASRERSREATSRRSTASTTECGAGRHFASRCCSCAAAARHGELEDDEEHRPAAPRRPNSSISQGAARPARALQTPRETQHARL